ncbi:uncharacterized protein BX663DRAFT_469984 [Cokeromyces recurvatus]|uniref:uncharacterized protein n=1 Tax=Cokeromyces recurvatus TaxID=90255 RepID=UPI00221F0DCE|nr:uncharacterized protein BX663DRAFT_469984 [Cokeromyces recurvatus]KAI7904875.1 hypothetical protein BX663DRAFT_469984 [Cokeromyces recurvatus]
MSIAKNEYKSVVLWHMNGCIATFYESKPDNQKKKVPIETVSFTTKAYLAFKKMNSLQIAPPAVPYLENLTSLQLQNNHLVSLPHELWRLTNLQELNLGSNQLKELPMQIGLLVNLRQLFLHNNHLTSIPSQIGNLKQLSLIDLTDNNRLIHLPAEILELKKLKVLWLGNNNFCQQKTNDLKVITLKSICLQTIGLLCSIDQESKQIISENLPESVLEDKSILLSSADKDLRTLIPRCYYCSSLLFHSDLHLIKLNKENLPFLFRACSQTCYVNIYNNSILY